MSDATMTVLAGDLRAGDVLHCESLGGWGTLTLTRVSIDDCDRVTVAWSPVACTTLHTEERVTINERA